MKVLYGIHELKHPLSGSVLSIGNFDGVHLGHQELIRTLVASAKKNGLPAIVMTFDPHPVQVLFPERRFHRLFSRQDQAERLKELGVTTLIIEPFSRELSEMPPEDFLEKRVLTPLQPKHLVVGHDFSFGANRSGGIELLETLAAKRGYRLDIVPAVRLDGETVSSTSIRKAIESGNIQKTERYLGRPFYLEGLVIRGDGRGKSIGIPTANLKTEAETLPGSGVYVTRATVANRSLRAVTNVGFNPTFQDGLQGTPRIETHILDLDQDIYGATLKIEFLHKLRDEKKFANAAELVEQIRKDIELGRKFG